MMLASVALLLPTVWIVDANSGPGSHFTDLPAAVAAAQSGDTIIVQAGTYSSFYVSGKALTIRGSGAAVTLVRRPWPGASTALPYETITIDNTPPGTSVYLGGLGIAPLAPTATAFTQLPPALLVLAGASVTIADCAVAGALQSPTVSDTGAAVEVRGELHAARTTFAAADASLTSGFRCVGGPGAVVSGRCAADRCRFDGGDAVGFGGAGTSGSGVVVNLGQFSATRTSCIAGFASMLGGLSGGSATGGSGLEVNGGAARISGTAADACASTFPSAGLITAGAGVRVNAGAASVHGPIRLQDVFGLTPATIGPVAFGPELPTVTTTSTTYPNGETDAGQPVTVTVQAPLPGALYVLLVDLRPTFFSLQNPPVVGEVLLPLDAGYQEFGVLDGLGRRALVFTPALAIPGLLGTPFHFQAAMLEPTQVRASSRDVRLFR